MLFWLIFGTNRPTPNIINLLIDHTRTQRVSLSSVQEEFAISGQGYVQQGQSVSEKGERVKLRESDWLFAPTPPNAAEI